MNAGNIGEPREPLLPLQEHAGVREEDVPARGRIGTLIERLRAIPVREWIERQLSTRRLDLLILTTEIMGIIAMIRGHAVLLNMLRIALGIEMVCTLPYRSPREIDRLGSLYLLSLTLIDPRSHF
ncbi:MAG: hypothetical protein LBS22_03150 [Puniceicoccales bacterium]|jgi:hypothetical protein|nr:hypothetical protein [Puniceicoccales bacterium]